MLFQTCVDIKVSSWFSVSLSDAKLKFLKENEKKIDRKWKYFYEEQAIFICICCDLHVIFFIKIIEYRMIL